MNLTDEVIFLNLNGGNSEEEKESTPHQTRLNGVYATWGGGGGWHTGMLFGNFEFNP